MKNKKLFMYLIIILLILLIVFVGFVILKKNKKEEASYDEYIPEQEITEEQLRTTIITLYFLNKEGLELVPEKRQIDVKELVDNPYEKLIRLLIEGPKNEELLKIIPENTKVNSVEKKEDILYLDLSKDFINEQILGKEQEMLIINSLVNTLTELTEINKVKILIDGKENESFPDNAVNFQEVFSKQ